MRKFLLVSIVVGLMPLAAFAASTDAAKKIQCWTDDKGVRSCGDHVPPQFAKERRDIYNSQGVVIGTQSRQKTPAEVAEEERQAAAAAAEQKRLADQAAYDRFLTDTYGSTKELETARDLRLQMLDGRIVLAKKALTDNQDALNDLHSRVENGKKLPQPEQDKLHKQVTKFEQSLAENNDALTQLQQERVKAEQKFNQDIQRFQQLRPGH